MAQRFVQLEGFLRSEPPGALATLSGALGEAGALVMGANAFSNIALSLSFELPAARLGGLGGCLERAGVVLFEGPERALAGLVVALGDEPEGEVMGQILVTLVHNLPDERVMVPAVPG